MKSKTSEFSLNDFCIDTDKGMVAGAFGSSLIDDVHIYNRALNAEEISALIQ